MSKLIVPLVIPGFVTMAAAAGPDFIVCKSTYALCTTASCVPIPGKKDVVACQCNVENDYSAGLKPCGEKKTAEGLRLHSRYRPISSYARCSNRRPWAWCLDAPCTVDKDNLVMHTGIYSSATIVELDQVTDFLKTHDTPLHPVDIKVYPEK